MTTCRNVSITLSLLALVGMAGAAPSSAQEGRAWGDIHVQTIDGAHYPFQSSGEFVASRSLDGDLEVQLRLESSGFSSHVSVATVVAAQVDSTQASVALGRDPMLHVDGEPTTLRDGFLELPDGGRIERAKKDYVIYWADGSILTIDVKKRHLNAFLRPAESRRSTLSGLFGNFNGNSMDDVDPAIMAANMETLSDLHPGLIDLARTLIDGGEDPRLVVQKESLFEYGPGQSTHTFRRPAPTREATTANLPAGWRRRAEEACERAGVTDPELLEACIVDVGYTRDESFAETAANVQARDDSNWDEQLAMRGDAPR